MIQPHHHPELRTWLETCASVDPAEAPGQLAVFADWLEEREDSRAGEIRKILHRGPVEVEPVYRPQGIPPQGIREDGAGDFKGYFPKPSPLVCWYCQCDGLPNRPQFLQPQLVEASWYSMSDRGHDGTLYAHGRCERCWDTGWAIGCVSKNQARREFLHRMRVECLHHFFFDSAIDGWDFRELKADGRWPAVVTQPSTQPSQPDTLFQDQYVIHTNDHGTDCRPKVMVLLGGHP